MNKDVFKKAFENVKPSEELVNSVLDIPNVSAVPKKTKRQGFYHKPRLIGVIAACVVFVIGVTAAAAELIDFEAVFGNRITVKDSDLASSLVGTVSKFKYKISDKDYKIKINGVTGDDKSVLVAAEISRKDGTPVTDCFVNPIQPEEKQLLTLSEETEILTEFTYSYSIDYRVNKAGNIELFINLYSPDSIDGKKMSFKGKNFYPAGAYIKFERQNETDGVVQTEHVIYNENAAVPDSSDAVIDINDILALDLKWEFSFTYKASDKSHEVKSLDAPEDSFLLNVNVHKLKSEEKFTLKLTAQPTYMEAGSTGGRVDFEYEATGYQGNHDYHTSVFENNEIYIIMNDGERVKAYFDGGYEKPDGNISTCSYGLTYWDENAYKIFINADDIAAISINGTVYELK